MTLLRTHHVDVLRAENEPRKVRSSAVSEEQLPGTRPALPGEGAVPPTLPASNSHAALIATGSWPAAGECPQRDQTASS